MSFVVPDDTVLVADGGLATELEARGNDVSGPLWSARLLMDAPEEVRDAHLAFFRAGAVIATSASYQASFDGFARLGLGRREAAGLMRRSVDLARAARAEMSGDGRTRWVAASVGPYGAALADGSEYRGRYGLSVRELAAWHRPRLEVLAGAGPDVLALETVPDIDEAEALMAAIPRLGIPTWLSYSIAGERTRAGQSLSEAFEVAAGVREVVAVGVNCCAPSDVPMAIAAAREVTGKPVIVYPNSGEEWDARRRAWTGRSQYSAGLPRQWITAGANVVGGCCRVRPADIAVIAQAAAGPPRCAPVRKAGGLDAPGSGVRPSPLRSLMAARYGTMKSRRGKHCPYCSEPASWRAKIIVRTREGGGGGMSVHAQDSSYALLTDGATIEIRAARPDDFDAVRNMHARMSPDNLYLRFFSMSPFAAEREARRICREPGPDHAALVAVLDGEVVGCGTYERDGAGSLSAEVAFTVADDMHHRGIGMLLLEHLVSLARGRGFRAFTAETLSENAAMLRVFADAGLQTQRALVDGVYDLTFPLPTDEADAALGTYRDTVAVRERAADVASMRHALMPASVAVIGASRRPGSVGRVILRNIIAGGFSGPVYPVNPGAAELDGIPSLPSAAALPEHVDLAVITVPAAAVLGVAEDCGRRGVKALVVIASGLSGPARAELLEICRRHGMRMIGPASFGVASPGIGLNATFAAHHPAAGTAGLALQSTGGTGFVLVEHLSRLGVGISTLVSFGDKDDVSGTDMLQWWESDGTTKLAMLYLESIGNPPKFARTARRVSRTTPVLTVAVGRSAAGGRLAGARAAKAATPLITRQALFEQAGVIATANFGELLDTAALLAAQPVPAGSRVAVVSNTRGATVLAADACGDAGLQMAGLAADTQRALREILPREAAVAGPVDTTLLVEPDNFRRCLEIVGADPGVDAVLALTTTTAGGDLVPQVSAARLPVPIAAAALDQIEAVRLLPAPDADAPAVPAYAYPESAARALGHAARYGTWLGTPPGRVPDLAGLRQDRARELVASILADPPRGGWLALDPTVELLGCYGVPLAESIGVITEDAAAAAAARFGSAVALRADVPGLLRSSDAGDVLTGLHGADEVRRGFRSLRQTFGRRMAGVIVQPVTPGGVEVRISMLREQVAGPLVLFGPGRADGGGLAGRAARLAPLTESDADDLIRSISAAPQLLGRRGAPAADLAALRDMLLRVSRMADDLPQIAELELSPVIARPDGVQAVDARIRIQAAEPADAHLRRLP